MVSWVMCSSLVSKLHPSLATRARMPWRRLAFGSKALKNTTPKISMAPIRGGTGRSKGNEGSQLRGHPQKGLGAQYRVLDAASNWSGLRNLDSVLGQVVEVGQQGRLLGRCACDSAKFRVFIHLKA